MFSVQSLFCCICKKEFEAHVGSSFSGDLGCFREGVCTTDCLKEKQWRSTLSTMRKEYYPKKEE